MNAQSLQPIGPVSPVPTVTAPMDIVRAALATGNVEMYKEAVALAKDMDAFAARKAFNNALADAKAEMPIIRKNRHVKFDSTEYDHEDLAEVVDTVVPIIAKHGLMHRWKTAGKPGEPVTVTCILSHRAGYQEDMAEISAAPDTSGKKNPIQAIKSTVSYLERITLMAALGLASRKMDDDGRGGPDQPEVAYVPPPGAISQEQVDQLRDALEDKGASVKAFLNWAKQNRIEDIPAEHFDSCKQAIANFRKA